MRTLLAETVGIGCNKDFSRLRPNGHDDRWYFGREYWSMVLEAAVGQPSVYVKRRDRFRDKNHSAGPSDASKANGVPDSGVVVMCCEQARP